MSMYQVTAIPVTQEQTEFLIECSDCGPVGSVETDDPGPFVLSHIANHTKEKKEQT
jgi:hypothetical protein